MLKTLCKNVVWMALPLGLAIGCAENRPATEASAYSPSAAPAVVLQPTSTEPEQRIYRENDTTATATVGTQNITVSAVPAGATQQTWAVAEEIRQKLTSDTSLAPLGSALIANVGNDGVVTLKGTVSSTDEQQRVCDSIVNLPGVHGVNDQLTIGSYHGKGAVNLQ